MSARGKSFVVLVDTDGTPAPDDRWRAAQAVIARYAGKKCTVTISACTRTVDQNALLHAIINDITAAMRDAGVNNPETGDPYTFETWREYFLDKHCPHKEIAIPDGRGVRVKTIRETTTRLNTAEFSALVESIRGDEVLIRRGIYIELPGDGGKK